jgi:copper(I)-binding protein
LKTQPACLAALLLSSALVCQSRASDLEVTGAWSRPTPPGATVAAVYFSVTNRGDKGDRLLGLSSAVAGKAELHESRTVRGVMEMHAVPGLECPPGATVTAHPNGVHAMLFGLTRPLIAGTTFQIAMQFRDAGKISIPVEVRTEAVLR